MPTALSPKKGRCASCRSIYEWDGRPTMAHAVCPECNVRLERTRVREPGKPLVPAAPG